MKKLISLIMAFCVLAPAASAELTKALQKQIDKEAQKQAADLKKAQWEVFGTSRTLEGSVIGHLSKTMNPGEACTEVVGVVAKIKSKSTGKQQALQNAAAQFAAAQVANVKSASGGAVAADASAFARFSAAFASVLEREVASVLRESYSVIRPVSPGVYDMQTVCTVSLSDGNEATRRALAEVGKQSPDFERWSTQALSSLK